MPGIRRGPLKVEGRGRPDPIPMRESERARYLSNSRTIGYGLRASRRKRGWRLYLLGEIVGGSCGEGGREKWMGLNRLATLLAGLSRCKDEFFAGE